MKYIQWPDNKNFAVFLSHDIDKVKKTYQAVSHFIKTKRTYHLSSLFSDGSEYWTFEKIMEIERSYGVRSTFFFLHETKKFDILKPLTFPLSVGYYKITEPNIANIIRTLDSAGWEIGLHGSFESFRNIELLKNEKNLLERIVSKPVVGIRQHFLNLDVPDTWAIQRALGFKYDASFGYTRNIGYRDNIFTIFRPFNDNFFCIPLTIMDGPLFSMYPNHNDAWLACLNLIDQCEKNRGILSILWHNDHMNPKEYPGELDIYKRIIEECLSRKAFFGTGEEIYQAFIGR